MAALTNNRFIKTGDGFVRDTPGVRSIDLSQTPTTAQIPGMAPVGSMGATGAPQVSPDANNPFLSGDYSNVTDPHDAFNLIAFDMLKKAQGVDNVELYKRRRDLQRAAIGESNNSNVSDIKTLSPEQQDSIRSGRTSALSVDIDQNAADIATHEQSIQNFQNVYQQALQFGNDFADKLVAPDSVIESYKKAIETNPDNLSIILSGVNNKTREKVIQSLDYAKLGPKTAKVDRNKLLTIEEATSLGVPYGTTVGQAIDKGITPSKAGGLTDKVGEQNALDYQTSNSAYQNILSVLPKDKTPETLTVADIEKMNNNDLDSIGKALARIQAPDISRSGGDPGSALDATSFAGKVAQYVGAKISGQKYPASEVLSAIQTATKLNANRSQSVGIGNGAPSFSGQDTGAGTGGIIPSAYAGTTGQTVMMTGPQGTFNVPISQVATFKQNGYK